jgi:multidrug efflux pump subunit AcrB
VVGRDPGTFDIAREIEKRVALVPGAVDVHLHQVTDAPELRVDVDRTKASELSLTQADVAGDVLVSLSGSGQTSPNYWLNPQNGVNYQVIVQTPQHKMESIEKLASTPISSRKGGAPQLLSDPV